MSDDPIDTGFDAVIAGEKWVEPEPMPAVTVTVNQETPYGPANISDRDGRHVAERLDAVPGSPQVDDDIDIAIAKLSQPAPVPSPTVAEGLTPAGVQAAKALVKLPVLTWTELAKLAREMAMNIKERHLILQEFKLSDTQYDFLEAHNEFYREAYKAACKEWHAPLSTQQRIEVEAAAILEDSLLILGARMQNKGEGLPGVIEAAKFFGKIARVGEREAGSAAPGERFSINIDLGGDKSLTVTATATAQPVEAQPPSITFSDDGKTT